MSSAVGGTKIEPWGPVSGFDLIPEFRELRAFFGKHRIVSGGKEQVVELKSSEPSKEVSFK